jgi:2-phospho-L-lactate guanylyltransferase
MPTIVVPFAGEAGKTRLHTSLRARRALSLAMLADVLAAATAAGDVHVVTADAEAAALAVELGASTLADPGGGQGAAVAAALAGLAPGAVLVVNADVPCVGAEDLRTLEAAIPRAGVALVEAADGTTNALGLSGPELFAPLYGPGSAARFRARATALGLAALEADVPNLADDVDTPADLERLGPRCGPRTQAVLELAVEAVR